MWTNIEKTTQKQKNTKTRVSGRALMAMTTQTKRESQLLLLLKNSLPTLLKPSLQALLQPTTTKKTQNHPWWKWNCWNIYGQHKTQRQWSQFWFWYRWRMTTGQTNKYSCKNNYKNKKSCKNNFKIKHVLHEQHLSFLFSC